MTKNRKEDRSAVPNNQSFVSHLECSGTGKICSADKFHGLSDDGYPLLFRYNLDRVNSEISRDQIESSSSTGFWKYRSLLPVAKRENIVSLGETETPLIPLNKVAKNLGAPTDSVLMKDEGYLPTGSFKARGLSVVVSVAKEFGVRHLVIPTAGNAGEALAAYAARAGIKATVICPRDAPIATIRQTARYTEELILVDGLINDCGNLIPQAQDGRQWRNISTFKEPYRVEGKKTIAFEIASQLKWKTPDYIFYPTGGGVGLIGIWKGFKELQELGWIGGHLPKMVAVQPEGCAPIVEAWAAKADAAVPVGQVDTVIHGMRVPAPFADRLMLKTLRESTGFGITISDQAASDALRRIARLEGQLLSLEGAAVVAAFEKAYSLKMIKSDCRVVLINSASGLKNDFDDEFDFVGDDFEINIR